MNAHAPEIIKQYGIISNQKDETDIWQMEVNLVQWNRFAPKLDIRYWIRGHGAVGKGIALSEDEEKKLLEILLERQKSRNESL